MRREREGKMRLQKEQTTEEKEDVQEAKREKERLGKV